MAHWQPELGVRDNFKFNLNATVDFRGSRTRRRKGRRDGSTGTLPPLRSCGASRAARAAIVLQAVDLVFKALELCKKRPAFRRERREESSRSLVPADRLQYSQAPAQLDHLSSLRLSFSDSGGGTLLGLGDRFRKL